jgi:hypothetical protein
MTEQDIKKRITMHEQEILHWRRVLATKGCNSCQHYAMTARACLLADGAIPPPDVVRTGCPSWLYDPIPF